MEGKVCCDGLECVSSRCEGLTEIRLLTLVLCRSFYPFPNDPLYAAAKQGVLGTCRAVGPKVIDEGITVKCVASLSSAAHTALRDAELVLKGMCVSLTFRIDSCFGPSVVGSFLPSRLLRASTCCTDKPRFLSLASQLPASHLPSSSPCSSANTA